MNKKIKLEWSYTPKSFLETEYSLDFDGVKIHFENGEITIHTDELSLQDNPFFVTNAEKTIRKFLNGIESFPKLPIFIFMSMSVFGEAFTAYPAQRSGMNSVLSRS